MSDDNDKPNEVSFSEADVAAREKAAAEKAVKRAEAEFARKQESVDLVSKLKDDGKLTPAMAVGLSDFLSGLENEQTFNFSVGEGEQKTAPQFDFVKSMLESFPANFAQLTAEFCSEGDAPEDQESKSFHAPEGMSVDADSLALHNKALSFQKNNPDVNYIDAVNAVNND